MFNHGQKTSEQQKGLLWTDREGFSFYGQAEQARKQTFGINLTLGDLEKKNYIRRLSKEESWIRKKTPLQHFFCRNMLLLLN